jgi:PPM family protein phosphatase
VSVRVNCQHCGMACHVPDEHLGKSVRCYQCKQIFTATMPPESADEDLFPDFDLPPNREPATRPCRLEIGSFSSRGRIRERNEDSCLVQQVVWMSHGACHEAALLVVADGMGGYSGGDQAGRLTIQVIGPCLAPLLMADLHAKAEAGSPSSACAAPVCREESSTSGRTGAAGAIEQAIKAANRAVHQQANANPGCRGMGATAAVVLVRDTEAFIGHVGDCRVYHHRDGRLTQVTRDQTLVERLIDLGQLAREKARDHPVRNEVTQAIGKRPDVEPARSKVDLAPGDWLLIACDGLTADMEVEDVESMINNGGPAREVARKLVELAEERGGSDNCTVIAACCY